MLDTLARALVIPLIVASSGLAQTKPTAPSSPAPSFPATPEAREEATPISPEQARREAAFEKTMTGATLVGFFTMDGAEQGRKLREERYTIRQVKKVGPDRWRFHARVQYMKFDVTVPMVLAVKWAGDTPVITLTDLKIPVLGTYTARVLIYRGHYAGTWSGKDHGGKLFGKIERAEAKRRKL